MFVKRKEYGGNKVYFINEAENVIIQPLGKNRFNINIVTYPGDALDPEAEIIELADISQDDVSQTFQIAHTFSAKEFKKLSKEVGSFVEKHKTVKV